MRKTGFIMALLALLSGATGWLLRRHEVATIFDPYTGLAETWTPVSLALILLSGATVLLLFALSRTVSNQSVATFQMAFDGSSFLTFLIRLSGFTLLALTALFIWAINEALRDWFWAISASLAGLCLLDMSLRGRRGHSVAITSVVPVLWLCMWLVFSYIDHATNPTLLAYIYYFFALAGLILGFYHVAGFAFGLGNPKGLLFSNSVAVYFTAVTMGDAHSPLRRGIFLALALILLVYQLLLGRNLSRLPVIPPQEEKPENNLLDADETL
ncbi:MAG: hypothetical protein FWD99_03165 [Oscillospiraceae bacterium]|nr:hypothetical protein [Oscillospiraceae bacterium]